MQRSYFLRRNVFGGLLKIPQKQFLNSEFSTHKTYAETGFIHKISWFEKFTSHKPGFLFGCVSPDLEKQY